MQQIDEIVKFLKDNIEPLEDNNYGKGYRASVHLVDGTFLPCVIFRSSSSIVNLALRRLKEEKGTFFSKPKTGLGYYNMVKHFVTTGNRLNYYDIKKVEKSKFAFPVAILKQIKGETTMGWTGFAAKMKDGKHIGFGTKFRWEFFDMPDEYSVDDILEIVNHSYVLKSGEIRSHKVPFMEWPHDYDEKIIYRERVYFECYLDNL